MKRVTYRVEDLRALVKVLKEDGCNVLEKIDDSEYGTFVWVMVHPEGIYGSADSGGGLDLHVKFNKKSNTNPGSPMVLTKTISAGSSSG